MTTNQLIQEFSRVLDGISAVEGRRAIKRVYGMARLPTEAEYFEERKNLQRKKLNGSLDTRQEHLAACLFI
jgi:hypothetical protein